MPRRRRARQPVIDRRSKAMRAAQARPQWPQRPTHRAAADEQTDWRPLPSGRPRATDRAAVLACEPTSLPAKSSAASSAPTSRRLQPQPRARRVMRGEHARRDGARLRAPLAQSLAQSLLDPLALDRARPQQADRPAEAGDDRRFEPVPRGPASRMKSTRPSRSSSTCSAVVGLTRPLRLAEGATSGAPAARDQRARDRVRRACAAPACRARRGRAARRASAAPGPRSSAAPARTPRASLPALARRTRASALRVAEIGDMGDQRIEARPALWPHRSRRRRRRASRARRGRRPSRSAWRRGRPRAASRRRPAIAASVALTRRVMRGNGVAHAMRIQIAARIGLRLN